MTTTELLQRIGQFRSAHGENLPGLIVVHPTDYLQMVHTIEEKYPEIRLITSVEVPRDKPLMAFTAEQYFLPITHPSHHSYQRKNLAAYEIKFKQDESVHHLP